jgi:L-alanine-DL-glutamate epimerase-like enolase superfamily enzyme
MPGSVEAPVTGVRVRAATFPTDGPEGDGTFAWDSTTVVVVEVEAGGGRGLGWTYAPAAAADVVTGLLAPVVRGRDALAPAAANVAMLHAVRNAGRAGLVAMALSAVDVALWDLAARLQDLPVVRLWGGPVGPVPVYGSGGFTTYDEGRLRGQLDGWLELGLPRVKIKIGESWGADEDRDLERVATARSVVGDATALFVDANGGYRVGQACRVGRRLDDLGVTWFEEPVSSDDVPGLARVRDAVAADVTAGEYGHDPTYFARLVPAVDCVQVDATRAGGWTGWLQSAATVAAHQRDVSGHCAPYLTAPVAAATPNLRHLEWFHDHVRIEQALFDGAADPVDGTLPLPDGPGHGLTLREDVLERHRVG